MKHPKHIFSFPFSFSLLFSFSFSFSFILCAEATSHAHTSNLSGVPLRADTVDTILSDTLREVVVEGRQELPVMEQFRKDVNGQSQPKARSLGDVLDRLLPNAQDKVLHPFAVKQRKRDRKRKKARAIIENYDKVETSTTLFDEIVRKQREEDERNGMTNWKQLEKK